MVISQGCFALPSLRIWPTDFEIFLRACLISIFTQSGDFFLCWLSSLMGCGVYVCCVSKQISSPQLPRESVFHCGVLYEDSLYSPFKGQLELHEDVKIYIEENYEQINVPVPQFGGSDPADIIHDFQRVRSSF